MWQPIDGVRCALLRLQGLLDELNKRLAQPLQMNRFRPNIVVKDCRPAEEDTWQEYLIGKTVQVESVKPCDRCPVSASWLVTSHASRVCRVKAIKCFE